MEWILLGWAWVVPAVAGAGAATYVGLTTRGRRARRLELDAARHEESQAYRELVAAKARVRVAQADVMTAKARAATPQAAEARRELQLARQDERSASLALRASRSRVKAGYSQYRAGSPGDPLPIERLWAEHDAANARWLSYETDVDKALKYSQVTDSRHPATVVFLRAQREALTARPTLRDRVSPQQYLEYRRAVRALQAALVEAERAAGVPGAAPPSAAQAAAATTAATISAAASMIADLADRLPTLISRPPSSAPSRERPPT
ncbi:hypothetical protein IF188_05700 [Microbacterium sp. NEAU-LLC]|uniref:Secreted protein n=1 Tax=Microbacterium helvum TaxID=2773713 RepID=A0ABR8NL68_9MICO|nr:hypothetical protein [Microbacterium helvum]MBD3941192.1 hypothetical protein [Microbacterium helvum]